MSFLSPTNLETADYNQPGWVHVFNKNLDKLNDTLLKISGLNDTDTSDVKDEAVLVWNATSSTWIPRNF